MRLVVTAVAALAFAACLASEEDLPQVQVRPFKSEWPRGEAVEVRVAFENTAGRAFTYTSSSCVEPAAWAEREDGADKKVWLRSRGEPDGCAHVSIEVTIPPGDRRDVIYVWNGSSDPSREGAELVPPGTYTLKAGFFGDVSWDTTGLATVRLT